MGYASVGASSMAPSVREGAASHAHQARPLPEEDLTVCLPHAEIETEILGAETFLLAPAGMGQTGMGLSASGRSRVGFPIVGVADVDLPTLGYTDGDFSIWQQPQTGSH